MKPKKMTRAEWDAACVVYPHAWSDHIWRGTQVVGKESGKYRVVTPDGADHPGRGETPAEAIESVAYFFQYFEENGWR